MRIVSLRYQEYVGAPQEWILEPVSFGKTNLIVGKNSTGKSRLLSVIVGLGRLIDSQQKVLFDEGAYVLEFEKEGRIYTYELELDKKKVVSEQLSIGDSVMFSRDKAGAGKIFFEKAEREDVFSIPEDLLVLSAKRDRIQHPYIEFFHEWAARIRFYAFGTSLGREFLTSFPDLVSALNGESAVDHNRLFDVYSRGFKKWKKPFDRAILRDLARLGYACDDVGIDQITINAGKPLQLAAIFVKEKELKGKTFQTNMSQGMFRALGMVIHLNFATFAKESRTVLIDDVGEGLDFERASAFVSLLIERCEKLDFQLFMTTNDRFVMNGVPIDSWCILQRDGSRVTGTTIRSAPKLFEEFKYVGLNNFDFFSTGYFDATSEKHQ